MARAVSKRMSICKPVRPVRSAKRGRGKAAPRMLENLRHKLLKNPPAKDFLSGSLGCCRMDFMAAIFSRFIRPF